MAYYLYRAIGMDKYRWTNTNNELTQIAACNSTLQLVKKEQSTTVKEQTKHFQVQILKQLKAVTQYILIIYQEFTAATGHLSGWKQRPHIFSSVHDIDDISTSQTRQIHYITIYYRFPKHQHQSGLKFQARYLIAFVIEIFILVTGLTSRPKWVSNGFDDSAPSLPIVT